MACFIVPLTQAIATTVYRKHVEKKVQLEGEKCLSTFNSSQDPRTHALGRFAHAHRRSYHQRRSYMDVSLLHSAGERRRSNGYAPRDAYRRTTNVSHRYPCLGRLLLPQRA